MSNNDFNWTRRWRPASADNEIGYGNLAESENWNLLSEMAGEESFPLEHFSNTSCLILLGERGMGKSRELEKYVSEGDTVKLFCDLGRIGSDLTLSKRVFESTAFDKWKDGEYRLEIILDSLDECLLELPKAAKLIIDELQQFERLPNLRLLVACRGSVFPKSFKEELQEIWGEENTKVLKLAPLSKEDVETAAESLKEKDGFLKILNTTQVLYQWACNPLTLNMLLAEFSAGELTESTSQSDLFERYCLVLCSDRYGKGAEPLQPEKLLTAAKWVAASMIFGKKSSILTGNPLSPGKGDGTEIRLSELAFIGNSEMQKGLGINEEDLTAAIKTDLFREDGDLKRWKHKGYSEYLAARFLSERKTDIDVLKSIFFNPDLSHKGPALVPQLFETATWLAALNKEFSTIITASDPISLLKSQIADFNPDTKSMIVRNLLEQANLNLVNDGELYISDHYFRLNHPNLFEDLKPYIESQDINFIARRMAIDISEKCKTKELLPLLLELAFNTNEEYAVRGEVVHAIIGIGDMFYVAKLKPLLDQLGKDTSDEVKGMLLDALWPDLIDTEEVLNRITKPKESNLYGLYKGFLTHTFPKKMPPSDLPLALVWVEKLEDRAPWYESLLSEFAGKVLMKAWEHFDAPGVITPLSRISLRGIKKHVSVFGDIYHGSEQTASLDDPRARRAVALEIYKLLTYPEDLTHWETISLPRYLLRESDFDWALEKLLESTSDKDSCFWSASVFYLWDRNNQEQFNAIYNVRTKYSELGKRLRNIIGPIDIYSPDSKSSRRLYKLTHEEERSLSAPVQYPKLAEEALSKWDNGDLNAWWILCRQLRMTPAIKGYNVGDEFDPDITKTPGWLELGEDLRMKLISLAHNHLLFVDPKPDEWFGQNIFHRPAAAGYYALWLLRKEAKELYDSLPDNIWAKWSCIVVGFSSYHSTEEQDLILEISKDCYFKAKIQTLSYITDSIKRDNSYINLNYKFESAMDLQLAETFANHAIKTETKPEVAGSLLVWLFNLNVPQFCELAYATAKEMFHANFAENEQLRERALVAGAILALQGGDEGWEEIKTAAYRRDDFAKNMLMKIGSFREHHHSRVPDLSELNLVDIYLLFRELFPKNDDPKHEGAHFVSPRDQVAYFRDSIPNILVQKASKSAISALEKIADAIDERGENGDLIRYYIPGTRTNLFTNEWLGIRPDLLAELLADDNKRLVRSDSELAKVVLESLGRYQEKLRGEGGLAHQLWNTDTRCPKGEEEISNTIRDFLSTDLSGRRIICNRNVDIRPTDEVDIKVEAVDPDGHGSYCVIIEAKGNWHPEVDSAMKSQLRDRYLTGNDRTNEGIYLVLWFPQDQYGRQCNKDNKSKNKTIDAAKDYFEKQAVELSTADIHLSSYVLDVSMQIRNKRRQ